MTTRTLLLLALIAGCNKGGGDSEDTDLPIETDETDVDTDLVDTDDTDVIDTDLPLPLRDGTTAGNAVAITSDSTIGVFANRTAGEITVAALDLPNGTVSVDDTIDVGENSEPWAAVIGNDDDTAFVVLRGTSEVIRIDTLSTDPDPFSARAQVDAEPSGIAISRDGTTLYVTNWAAGTVSVIDAATMAVTDTVDLNAALVDSGLLGASVTASRPGLAHPYAIVVTDDGDGSNPRAYVTEFFSQDDPDADPTQGDSFFDVNRQGLVYRFDLDDLEVHAPIEISAFAQTGFLDANGVNTGCFPNQLYSIAADAGRLYITGMCESPRGPAAAKDSLGNPTTLHFKTKVHSAVYVIDGDSDAEEASNHVLLTKKFEELYVANAVTDDSTRRYPLLPVSIQFVPGDTGIGYIAAYGADAMFRVKFDPANGSLLEVGASTANFVDLSAGGGALPIGVWVTNEGHAVLLNESTRNVTVVALNVQAVASTTSVASAVSDTLVNDGRKFFVTGRARWSFNGQGWNSCESCHPFGLTDNVTWFFPNGPRQSTSLDGSYDVNGNQRIFNWAAILDETADFEENTRGVSGGVGAIVHTASGTLSSTNRIIFDGSTPSSGQASTALRQDKLVGSTYEMVDEGVLGTDASGNAATLVSAKEDWLAIDAYIATIRAPHHPDLSDHQSDVDAGESLFETNGCNGCHGGDDWTISMLFYDPSAANNTQTVGLLDTTQYTRGTLPTGLNPAIDRTPTGAPLRSTNLARIQCALRAVGTFPASGTTGIAPTDLTISERKEDMISTADGADGLSPPSLLGVGVGAPYFHAGNARTIEEALDGVFDDHYTALSANFSPTATQKRQLALYLLSIDDEAAAQSTTVTGIDPIICPDSL